MITSDVGRIASRSANFSPPPSVTHATFRRKPLDVLGFAHEQRLRDQQRKIGVLVAGVFKTPVEFRCSRSHIPYP